MLMLPMTLTPAEVARGYSIIDEFDLVGKRRAVIFDAQTPRAAIIKMDTDDINGTACHRVSAVLDLAVVNICKDAARVLQITGFFVIPAFRNADLEQRLIETLVSKCGIVVASPNEQYESDKDTWQQIARESSSLVVRILDTDTGQFYPYDGTKARYDGGDSIPDHAIWSTPPDESRTNVLLIAEPIA